MSPSPRARLAAFALGIMGALIAHSPVFLLCSWLGIVVPLSIVTKTWRPHLRFCLTIVAPISAMLAIVWIYLLGAPPGSPRGTDVPAAATFAALTAMRLTMLGGCAQLLFLTIPGHQLVDTFRQWGLRGDLLVAALGTFILGPELRIRADQIVTARMARGHLANRTLLTRLRQLVPSLGVLFTLSVRSAVQRASHWQEQDLFEHFSAARPTQPIGNRFASASIVVVALIWTASGLGIRLGSL